MNLKSYISFLIILTIISFTAPKSIAQVHTSYLWHLQQPIYWPEKSTWNQHEYQSVRESQELKFNGGNVYLDGLAHPLNNLEEIFGNDDRKAVYQYRAKDAVQSLTGYNEAGAQVNYSGCLIKNVNSLAENNQWGYYSNWQNSYVEARGWSTTGGNPRMDIVGFTFHHSLAPLLSERVLRKEIQAHRYIYNTTFGTNPNYSKGFWPAECAFSQRIIKVLVEEGFEWSVIANSHLARTLNDYPLSFGTNACNMDPPNAADVIPTNGNNWWNGQIDGRGGTFAAPYCYQAHKAKYVDPETAQEYKITVVPMCDLLSYINGYSTMGTGEIDNNIAPYNNPQQPSIVLMAHDGDNAWGGGFDYYNNSVPGFAESAASQGYVPTTIQQFLDDHPVPENDVVHVEDGAWVNAANDWGHPQFINWIWPMYNTSYEFDPNGWTEDARNWAVLVAAENRVCMAEDLSSDINIQKVVYPDATATNAEIAWHFLLPGYTSGYMYYGTSLDMEVKQTIACNNACEYADIVINANSGIDNTPPAVFIPQRYPYNPGGIGFGPTYGYQQHQNSSNFTVWTFAYDVSGLSNVTLKYRTDNDGINPINNNENETYEGGSSVGAWQSINMTYRDFPEGNITSNPEIDFFELPDYIADQYYAEIIGEAEVLIDYYVEATDNFGNTFKTPIQHVYVGESNTGGSGGNDIVQWNPANPNKDDIIEISVNQANTGGKLHWGVNDWQEPNQLYWPTNTSLFNGEGPAVQSQMEGPIDETLAISIGPFNNEAQEVNEVNFVISFNNNTWNNNNGMDYKITIDQTSNIDNIQDENISLYMNNSDKNLYVSCNENNFIVCIFDANGRIVSKFNNLNSRFLGHFNPGIYIVKVITSTHQVYTQKIVVM
jgi:hypothetical protein